jgi:hypothetical protein
MSNHRAATSEWHKTYTAGVHIEKDKTREHVRIIWKSIMIFVREFVGGINCLSLFFFNSFLSEECVFFLLYISNSNGTGVHKRREREHHPQLDSERHTLFSLPIINGTKYDLLQTDRRGLKNAKVFFFFCSSSRDKWHEKECTFTSIVCC